MIKNVWLIASLVGLCGADLLAQHLPVDRAMTRAYQRETRSDSGLPGKYYWQNRGDYQIDVRFDPESRLIEGTVHIDYVNNSPDTLKRLLIKLYPNVYRADAMRNTVIASDDLGEGVEIRSITVSGRAVESSQRAVRGTNMTVKGVTVLPQTHATLEVAYRYYLNKGSFTRTGQIDEGSFFIAYFFPRITVYDDVDGWNEYPYMGKEEFYNDYGNFKLSVTVPGDYCVWATGDLKNTAEVYTPEVIKRITQAETHDGIVDVITAADITNGTVTRRNPTNTWRFEANEVPDVAFAVSRNYVWKSSSLVVDSASGRRTRVDAVYHPGHTVYVPVVAYTRKVVELISHDFPGIPFPYPHMTIVDGLDAMEYPMMVNNLPFEDPKDVIEFTAHEVFHSIFPFYVGTNETKYSFMDEGWATLTEFMFHSQIDSTVALDYDVSPVNDNAGSAEDMPVMTPTAQLYGKARYADKDLKPALALYYLKEMLGDAVFVKAMRQYIAAWAGKHPTPYDFFNSMRVHSGVSLDWYWNKWWFEKAVPDLAIAGVRQRGKACSVTIHNTGGAPVPIHLTIVFEDGTRQTLARSAMVWKDGNPDVVVSLATSKRKIMEITLGGSYDADTRPADNVWRSKQSH